MGNQSAQNSRIKSRLHQYFFKRSYNHAWIFTYSSFKFLEAHRPKLFGFYRILPYAVPIVCSGNLKKADGGIYFDIYLQNQTCIIFWLSSQNVKNPKTWSTHVSNSNIYNLKIPKYWIPKKTKTSNHQNLKTTKTQNRDL